MKTVSQSSTFNLQMMNLFLGLCKGAAGLPRDFRNLGYKDKWIEYNFSNERDEEVVPELIIASEKCGHTLLLEWKSGANTDNDQLRRYEAVTAKDLNKKAFLTPAESRSHDVTIVGKNEYRERIQIGVTKANLRFPILIVRDDGLEKVLNAFSNQLLDSLFSPVYAVDFGLIPTYLYPVDKDCPLWQFAEVTIPVILEWMHAGKTRIRVDELASEVIPDWPIVAPNYRRPIEKKLREVLSKAERHDFHAYIKRNREMEAKTGSPTFEILQNPISLVADKRRAEWRKLCNLQTAFIRRLQRQEGTPTQPTLFAD